MKIYIIYFLVVHLMMASLLAQSQGLGTSLANYFDRVRNGIHTELPHELTDPENENAILDLLRPYFRDTIQAVRKKAYEVTYFASSRSENTTFRNRGINTLISACSENESEIKGMVLEFLTGFGKEDFSVAAKDSLRILVRNQIPHFDRLLKLAGFLDLSDLIPDILPFSRPGNPAQIRWAAILSLARMSERLSIAELMKRVKKLPVNDDLVYKVFPDLIYTRQPEPLEYIIETLQSDAKNCMSADAEREIPVLCGYRIMELLAPVIDGYPLQLDKSGDIITEDYSTALESVRHWFQINKTYKILNDKY
ncbi:MAG: hypothetical protein WD824_25205 [Cyclobacteriaceae bacterium]